MNSIKLLVKTRSHNYPIHIGSNILNKLQKLLKKNLIDFNQCLVVVDKNVLKKLVKLLVFYQKKKLHFIILMPVKKIKIKKV